MYAELKSIKVAIVFYPESFPFRISEVSAYLHVSIPCPGVNPNCLGFIFSIKYFVNFLFMNPYINFMTGLDTIIGLYSCIFGTSGWFLFSAMSLHAKCLLMFSLFQ